jgi:hypothetical protein
MKVRVHVDTVTILLNFSYLRKTELRAMSLMNTAARYSGVKLWP